MPERTINWGPDEATAQYQTGEDQATGNFVVANDTDGGTILLEYDETAGEWVSRGPVNMSGNDVSNVGTLSATAVDTDEALINSNQLYLQGSEPSSPSTGDVWIDNDG